VIAIPIYNYFLYPTLRKLGINFGLIQRSEQSLTAQRAETVADHS
jgi:hypothetical protein